MEEIDLVRIVLALSFFSYASISDWKTRRVRNSVWIILGISALVIFWIDLATHGASLLLQSSLLPIAFLFLDVFWERGEGIKGGKGKIAAAMYAMSFVWFAYVVYSAIGDPVTQHIAAPLVAFVMIIIFELFYMFDVIKGGADAKALISLAILVPHYPDIASSIPLISPSSDIVLTIFPFALSVLFMGALAACLIPIYFLAKNIKKGEKAGIKSLLGFKMPIDEVENHFVWLLEWADGGQVRFNYRKMRDSKNLKADLEGLRGLGKSEVWVTYKIPFIIPLTAGMLFVLIVGNLLFLVY